MVLIFDIGNTNIKCVIMNGEKISYKWRINTNSNLTADEYCAKINEFFEVAKIITSEINLSVISSVVPLLTDKLSMVAENIIGKKPIVISPKIYDKLPIKLCTAIQPTDIGTDLLCDALSAWEKFHSACIIVDFGTALSFVTVDSNAYIVGVAIAPGIYTAMKALASNAAQLPEIPLEAPLSPLGTDTVASIQSGVVIGYKCMVEGMIDTLKSELAKKNNISEKDIHTMATGGLSTVIAPLTNVFDFVDTEATLKGIAIAGNLAQK